MLKLYHPRIATYGLQVDDEFFVVDGGHAEFGTSTIPDFYRNYVGASSMDALFLTHYHNHHLAGIPGIIRFFGGDVKHLYTPGIRPSKRHWPQEWADIRQMEALIDHYGIAYDHLHSGMTIQGHDSALSLHAIHPHRDWITIPGVTEEHPNGRCGLMLLVTYGKFRMLFTGDVHVFNDEHQRRSHWENHVFKPLADILGDTKIHVVQVPHHGMGGVEHDWWIETLDADLYLLDGMPWNQATMVDALNRCQRRFYSHFAVPQAWVTGYLELHANLDGTCHKQRVDSSVRIEAPEQVPLGSDVPLTSYAYAVSRAPRRYEAYPQWPDHYPVERLELVWELVAGSAHLIDCGHGSARLRPQTAGRMVVRAHAAHDPTKVGEVTIDVH